MTISVPGTAAAPESSHRRTYLTAENKTQFWAKISQLLLQEANIGLRDPAGTMRGIVIARRAQQKVQDRESGTVQEDTKFTKAVDKWIKVEDFRQREREESKTTQAQVEKEHQEATRHRFNLLQSAHKKRYYSDIDNGNDYADSNSEHESEAGGEGGSTEKQLEEDTIERMGHLRIKTRTRPIKEKEELRSMSDAVVGLSDSVKMVAEKIRLREGSAKGLEDRVQHLEERIREDLQERKELRVQQEQGNKMLEAIVHKLYDGN
ncbi:hypothetical protein B9Z19DRAFT_1133069 [Tuber borchii]|uniref:Uncharacterized protein n=1 Tax=Tuber borchii TaxID=42251 RepID=A0A2T6ZGQ5_TUBBO|nr:hypothetical protein B9Z19DRAFT_1133069 [Tuber borchii]